METRALILGATGMLGCHAVHAALRREMRVRALVRPESSARILAGLPVEIVAGDLRDTGSLAAALDGCELVIHAAAPYPRRHFGKAALLRDGEAGMRSWLDALAARRGTLRRAVYVSSVTTIGRPESGRRGRGAAPPRPAHESDTIPIRDSAPYFALKSRLEARALEAAAQGLPLVVVNPTFCVDEFDDHRTTAQLLVPLARGLLPAYIPGLLNAVPARDVGEGILLAAERGRVGERYILGGENLTSKAFLERCARIAGVRPPRLALPIPVAEGISFATELAARLTGTRPLFPMTGIRMLKQGQAYDTTKAVSELGYSPTALDDAIARAYAWYRRRGFL
jgi:dihydroflavonol-4-reductase